MFKANLWLSLSITAADGSYGFYDSFYLSNLFLLHLHQIVKLFLIVHHREGDFFLQPFSLLDHEEDQQCFDFT